jgi:hypothetical protein
MTTKVDLYTPRAKLKANNNMLLNKNGMSLLLGGVKFYISVILENPIRFFEISLSLVNISKCIEGQYFLGVGTNN